MSFLFFRCRFCGWTQPTINPTEDDFEKWLSCCPACEAEYSNYQDYLEAKEREESGTETFHNGDAVVAHDGGWSVTGVISDVYDDVVDVDYFDTETKTMETMDFHIGQKVITPDDEQGFVSDVYDGGIFDVDILDDNGVDTNSIEYNLEDSVHIAVDQRPQLHVANRLLGMRLSEKLT